MSWLECSYYAEEFGECTDVHFREVVFLKLAEVAIVADDIGGSGDDGTVNKFVIVGICLDEVEAIGRIDVLHVGRSLTRQLVSSTIFICCMVFFRAGSTIRRASAA